VPGRKSFLKSTTCVDEIIIDFWNVKFSDAVMIDLAGKQHITIWEKFGAANNLLLSVALQLP
jgi:carbon starvation protein CstA